MTSVRWLGHASALIELSGARVLTDPVTRPRIAHLSRRVPGPSDVGDVDLVLISHVHRDHLDLPSLGALAGVPQIVVPPGAGDVLRRRGFEAVTELSEGQSMQVSGVRLTATPARHQARRTPLSPLVPSLGFVIEAGLRVYFAGDTDLYASMSELAPVDVALLPVWGWGASVGAGHLNPRTAVDALRLLRPRIAVPIHWGTFFPLYRRGPVPGHAPLEFARLAAELTPDVQVHVLQPGETLALDPV